MVQIPIVLKVFSRGKRRKIQVVRGGHDMATQLGDHFLSGHQGGH